MTQAAMILVSLVTNFQLINYKNSIEGLKKKKVFLDVLLDCYDQGQLDIDEVQEEVDTFMFEVLKSSVKISPRISYFLGPWHDHFRA